MTTKIDFFATRDAAKQAAKDLSGKFKDMGSDQPKGSRWAVETLVEASDTGAESTKTEIELLAASIARTKAIDPNITMFTSRKYNTVLNGKGKTVKVYTRPSIQARM